MMNKEQRQLTKQQQMRAAKKRFAMILIVLSLMVGGTAACGGFLLGSHIYRNARAKEAAQNQKYYTSIEIKEGDSLWSIAQAYMSDEYNSVQEYIEELKVINALDSDRINETEYLTVAYYL